MKNAIKNRALWAMLGAGWLLQRASGSENAALFELPPAVMDSVVIVQGSEGRGSGFLMRDGSNVYLYSNLHVLSGNRALSFTDNSGRNYRVTRIECASDRDLVRMTLQQPPKMALTLARSIPVNTPIAVCGNAGGEEIFRPVYGTVLGTGPKKVETDAKFIPGHSGSPMVTKDGTVVGVATYLIRANPNWTDTNSPFTVTRRIGCRIDTVPSWLVVSQQWFVTESRWLRTHEQKLQWVLAVVEAWGEDPLGDPLPCEEKLPKDLLAWVKAHNEMVMRLAQVAGTAKAPVAIKELASDAQQMRKAIGRTLDAQPLRWHLSQFKEEWADMEQTRSMLDKAIGRMVATAQSL